MLNFIPGHLNSDGIDDSSSSTLLYSNGKTATLIVNGTVRMDSVALIVGTKGTIKVSSMSYSITHTLHIRMYIIEIVILINIAVCCLT